MTDQTGSNASKEPASSVPQEVADELAQLAVELHAMERKAVRGWKTTAIAFAVLLAVIASYLGFGVYRLLKENLKEDAIVEIAFKQVDNMLAKSGAPGLNDPAMVDWAVAQLAKQAPEVMDKTVKPYIEDSIKRLPEWRKKLVEQVKAKGPGVLDKGIEAAQAQFLPSARQWLVERSVEGASGYLDQIEPQMDQAIHKIIEAHMADMKNLNPENQDTLKRAMEESMEAQLAPILDPMFQGITHGMDSTHLGLIDLLGKLQAGTLTHEERLEIGLVQLTYAVFQLKAASPEESGMGLWDQIQQIIQKSSEGLNMPGAAPGAAPVRGTAAPAAVSPARLLQAKIKGLEEALKQPNLPDAERKQLQQTLDEAQKQLQALPSRPAAAAPAAASAPVQVTKPPSPLERAKMEVEALQKALDNPNLPAQGRTAIQAQLEAAKKKVQELQTQQ